MPTTPPRDDAPPLALQPKYSITEVERRWLVDLAAVGPFEGLPYHEIEDLYIAETQLRLRKITNPQGEVVLKLCKKYGKTSALSEPITNLYLSAAEYARLAQLPGNNVRKHRYPLHGGALDLYIAPVAFAVFEAEFPSESEAKQYVPPKFVREEISNNPAYSGAAIATGTGSTPYNSQTRPSDNP